VRVESEGAQGLCGLTARVEALKRQIIRKPEGLRHPNNSDLI
jgi:hypothetical protein